MEASMNVGVRPIERPQAPSVDGVGRRGDGGGSSAAFSPKTNVSIQNAVDDMAGVLAKISTNQMDAVEKMPEDFYAASIKVSRDYHEYIYSHYKERF